MEQQQLTHEQTRRIEIFERYDAIAGPVRNARNEAITSFDLDWRDRSIVFFADQEKRRLDNIKTFESKGLSSGAAYAATAFELAKEFEAHLVAKDRQARELDETLQKPKAWREFLEEENQRSPGDPVIATLMKEAEHCDHDAAVSGYLKTPPPERVLSDLSLIQDEDGTAFKRGTQTVFRDVGPRLDVSRTDRRDIAAALKVAAQKFDPNKGLVLTGDTAFKTLAAEVAGSMGLKLRNTEPEVLHAWERGRKSAAELTPSRAPSVARGIAGDIKEPGIDRVGGEQLLMVEDKLVRGAGAALSAAGVEFVAVGNNRDDPATFMMAKSVMVKLPGDRTQEALAELRGLSRAEAEALGAAMPGAPNPALKQHQVLVERSLIDEEGQLTPRGIDVVLVRGDLNLRERGNLIKQVQSEGVAPKSGAEFAREASGELKAGAQQTMREDVEASAQKKEAEEVPLEKREDEVEKKEQAHERNPFNPPRRKKTVDLGMER